MVRRAIFYSTVRASSVGPPKDKLAEAAKIIQDREEYVKTVKDGLRTVTDNVETSMGYEKFEYLQTLAGKRDPFEMSVQTTKEDEGTAENPTLVPSTEHARLIGCLCDDDAIGIKWTMLNQGESRRCDCGKWFKLVPLQADR